MGAKTEISAQHERSDAAPMRAALHSTAVYPTPSSHLCKRPIYGGRRKKIRKTPENKREKAKCIATPDLLGSPWHGNHHSG